MILRDLLYYVNPDTSLKLFFKVYDEPVGIQKRANDISNKLLDLSVVDICVAKPPEVGLIIDLVDDCENGIKKKEVIFMPEYDIGCEFIDDKPAYCTGVCIENIAGNRYTCCPHFKMEIIKSEGDKDQNVKKETRYQCNFSKGLEWD
jgi:hypothetical protein